MMDSDMIWCWCPNRVYESINGTFTVYVPTFRLSPVCFHKKCIQKHHEWFTSVTNLPPFDPVTLSPRMKDWHCPAANVLNDLSPTMSAHDATEVPCTETGVSEFFFFEIVEFCYICLFQWIIKMNYSKAWCVKYVDYIQSYRFLTLKYHLYFIRYLVCRSRRISLIRL